jgi:hypothetical protein
MQTCSDGDRLCDLDPMPGHCRFEVVLCLNNLDANLPLCVPHGVRRVEVRPSRPYLFRSTTVLQLANANVATVRAALIALRDPMEPGPSYTHHVPLTMAQRNFCSAPMLLDVLSGGDGPHAGDAAAQTLTIVSEDDGTPHRRRAVSRLRLKCQARPLP